MSDTPTVSDGSISIEMDADSKLNKAMREIHSRVHEHDEMIRTCMELEWARSIYGHNQVAIDFLKDVGDYNIKVRGVVTQHSFPDVIKWPDRPYVPKFEQYSLKR